MNRPEPVQVHPPSQDGRVPYDDSHMYPPEIEFPKEPPTPIQILEEKEAAVEMMWPGMTRPNFLRFGSYLRDMADQLGLRDWTIVLQHDPYMDDEDAAAATKCLDGQKRAKVWLSRDFADYSPEDQKHYLIHELLHLIFDPLSKVLWTAHGQLGESAFRILDRNHDAATELAVDGLSVELVRFLPDIPS